MKKYTAETTAERRSHWKSALAVLTVAGLCFAVTACADDSDTADNGSTETSVAAGDAAALLGEPNAATGEAVKLGYISDGVTQAFDNSGEFDGAKAAAEYWNEYQGGIAGHMVEVETCETAADPATAADCANKFITEGVVGVLISQSTVAESAWKPINDAGIPFMLLGANGAALLQDTKATYNLNDGNATLFALPISLAKQQDIKKIAFVIIDVPQALTGFEGPTATASQALADAGLEYDLYKVPLGTADMTSQMQQIAQSDAGLTFVVGNDSFCIAAFNGLQAVGYEGETAAVAQCITDATREAIQPSVLEGMYLTATVALGATDDESWQRYVAIMDKYAPGTDLNDSLPMLGYTTTGALLTSVKKLTGDVTADSMNAAIKAMDESVIPGTAGMKFKCDGKANPANPSVCSSQVLQAQLDAEGFPTMYTVGDLPH